MPSFLNDLRRLSSRSFRSDRSSQRSSDSSAGLPSTKSTSTLNTAGGSTTPPSTLPSEKSSSNLQTIASSSTNPAPPVSIRPSVYPSQSSRYSITVRHLLRPVTRVCTSLTSTQGASTINLPTSPGGTPPRSQIPTSPFAPRVLTVSDNSWVNARFSTLLAAPLTVVGSSKSTFNLRSDLRSRPGLLRRSGLGLPSPRYLSSHQLARL